MTPTLIKGNHHTDARGTICFNNNFNALGIKRVYLIENSDPDFIRAWQGHQIEQRWFSAVTGSFTIQLIEINNWTAPSRDAVALEFVLRSESLDVLPVPKGFVSSIKANENNAKLMVFADYELGEVKDEYRFPPRLF